MKANNIYNNQNYILPEFKRFKGLLSSKKVNNFVFANSFFDDDKFYMVNKKVRD